MGIRHIYTLVVDVPDSSEEIAHVIGRAADEITGIAPANTHIALQNVVPTNNGNGYRPVVRLEEGK